MRYFAKIDYFALDTALPLFLLLLKHDGSRAGRQGGQEVTNGRVK
jgi:hypothetical protein